MAGMKSFGFLLIAIWLLAAASPAQETPDAPASAFPLSDPEWRKVEQLGPGQEISIRVRNAPPLDCRFAGATDTDLFCDQLDGPAGEFGYRVARADVLGVRQIRPKRDLHPGLAAGIVITGSLVGLAASRNGTAGQGAVLGALAGLTVAGIAYMISHSNGAPAGPGPFIGSSFRSQNTGGRLRLRPHPLPRLFTFHALFH